MAKVFGIHHLQLKNTAKAAEFEQIISEEFNALPNIPGWHLSIVKGDRGQNVGKYVLIFEVESVEVRNQGSPGDGTFSPEVQKWLDMTAPTFNKLSNYITAPLGGGLFTDYVTVGK
jgi:hypothetical protein